MAVESSGGQARPRAGGKALYGAPLGILMLEARFPRIPGDMGNGTTWPFPVLFRVVRGASPEKVVLQGAREHWSNHFNHRNSADQISHRIAMRSLELVRVDTIPNLAFQKSAGYQLLIPQLIRRESIFCQQMCERH